MATDAAPIRSAAPRGPELLPDYAHFPALALAPRLPQRLRTALLLPSLPPGLDAATVMVGATLPEGFLPLGLAAPLAGPPGQDGRRPLPSQVIRSAPPGSGAEAGLPTVWLAASRPGLRPVARGAASGWLLRAPRLRRAARAPRPPASAPPARPGTPPAAPCCRHSPRGPPWSIAGPPSPAPSGPGPRAVTSTGGTPRPRPCSSSSRLRLRAAARIRQPLPASAPASPCWSRSPGGRCRTSSPLPAPRSARPPARSGAMPASHPDSVGSNA